MPATTGIWRGSEKKGERAMAKTFEQKMAALSAARRKKVESRVLELIEEEKSLRDLRRDLELTQNGMADELGIGQEGVSRLEKRGNLLVSTLRGYVEAMGGKLRLVAEFPDRPPVMLGGLNTDVPGKTAGRKALSKGKIARTGRPRPALGKSGK